MISLMRIDGFACCFLLFLCIIKDGSCLSRSSIISTVDKELPIFDSDRGLFMGHRILNRVNDLIFIGGRGQLLVWNVTSNVYNVKTFPICEKRGNLGCNIISSSEKTCQNYIRIAEYEADGRTLLVCGTNAATPMCYYCEVGNDLSLSCGFNSNFTESEDLFCDDFPEFLYDGIKIAPITPDQNSIALVTGGYLFEGIYDEQNKNKPFIRKWIKGERFYETFIQTPSQNAKSVNEADFVGKPYESGDHIYFFYRETAVEGINQGKFVYSRVARVCKNDTSANGKREWASFSKARLNCSLQGDYPFYFNYIQDVFVEENQADQETYFHAVFTTTPSGPPASAVCSFRLQDIKNVFEKSKFKGAKSYNSLWLPLDNTDSLLPSERVGKCEAGFRVDQVNFLNNYPLLNDLVRNYKGNKNSPISEQPHFYMNGIQFTQIARDFDVDAGNEVFYVGTSNGTVLKAFRKGGSDYEVYQVNFDNRSPVTGLEFINSNKTLIITTERNIYTWNAGRCNAFCEKECDDFCFPYCQWTEGKCMCGDEESQREHVYSAKIFNRMDRDTIESCHAREIGLTCEAYTCPLCTKENDVLEWRFDGKDVMQSGMGHLITYTELTKLPNHKVTHLTIKTLGDVFKSFSCVVRGNNTTYISTSVELAADKSTGCLTESGHREWKEDFMRYEDEYDHFKKQDGNNCTLGRDSLSFYLTLVQSGEDFINTHCRTDRKVRNPSQLRRIAMKAFTQPMVAEMVS